MKVTGLDGREYTWNLSKYMSDNNAKLQSKLHVQVRALLKEMFPSDIVLEELTLPGTGKTALYADFYIHTYRLMVEVNGEQHYKFNKFFHQNKANFMKSIQRDNLKKEWAERNGIVVVELPYNETLEEWRQKIEQRHD